MSSMPYVGVVVSYAKSGNRDIGSVMEQPKQPLAFSYSKVSQAKYSKNS